MLIQDEAVQTISLEIEELEQIVAPNLGWD